MSGRLANSIDGFNSTPLRSKLSVRLDNGSDDMDSTPLRKRLADLEMRRQTLVDAMSKYQEAKKSALFQYLSENQFEDTSSLPYKGSKDFPGAYRAAVLTKTDESRDCSHLDSIRDTVSSSRDVSTTSIHPKEEIRKVLPPIAIDKNDRSITSLTSWAPPLMDESIRSTVSSESSRREQRSRVLAEKRQNYRRRQIDTGPTQSIQYLPRRTISENSVRNAYFLGEKDTSSENFLGESDAPSDELITKCDTVDDNTPFQLPDKNRYTAHEAFKEMKYSQGNHSPKYGCEPSSFDDLNQSVALPKSKNKQGKHPIIARLRELNESNSKTISNAHENKTRSRLFNRLDEMIEDADARSTKNDIREKERKISHDRRGKHEVEERFLKLFVDEGDEINSKKAERLSNSEPTLIGKTSEGLRYHAKKKIVLDCVTDKSKDTDIAIATPADNDDGCDHMALLEKKLNMMISRKPLWQKALQDLYDEPIDGKLSASASSSSGITKPPSEAETICSSNPTIKENESNSSTGSSFNASTTIKSEKNVDMRSEKDLVSETETDTLESWRIQSSCSSGSRHEIEPSGGVTSEWKEIEMNDISAKEGQQVEEGGSSGTETETIESESIQNAKSYLDDVPECLSDLYETISTGDESNGETGIDKDNVDDSAPKDAESVSCGDNLPQEEVQRVSANDRQECLSATLSKSNQSSVTEEEDDREWRIEDVIVEYVERDLNNTTIQATNSSGNSIKPLDDEWVGSLHAGFVHSLRQQSSEEAESENKAHQDVKIENSPSIEEEQKGTKHDTQEQILTIHSQSTNHHIEVEIESPRKFHRKVHPFKEEHTVSNHSVLQHLQSLNFESHAASLSMVRINETVSTTDEEQVVSNYNNDQEYELMALSNYTEDERHEYMASDSKEQLLEVEVDSQSITVIDDCSTPTNEDQVKQEHAVSYEEVDVEYEDIGILAESYEEIDVVESYEEIDVCGDSLRMNRIHEAKMPLHDEQMVLPHYQQQDAEQQNSELHLQSNRWEMDMRIRLAPEIDRNRRANDSTIFGAVSDMSDEDSLLLELSSSSNSVEEVEIGSGDCQSEGSSKNPQIPNEVTMLTDFTVQSITYASNSSNVESLGEESIVRQAKKNRQLCKSNMMSSNSESTIIAERRIRGENETAFNVDNPNIMCTESLLKIMKNPTVLFQCTGPVALNDIIDCDPKNGYPRKFAC